MNGHTAQPVLAFCLFRYFPHGGLERDMLAIAKACQQRGYAVRVYTQSWQGDRPEGVDVRVLACGGFTNHGKAGRFADQVRQQLAADPVDLVVGFNKMPGLDIYYAADGCYKAKVAADRSLLVRMTGRYRLYQAFEEAVFGPGSPTHVLAISPAQAELYARTYGTHPGRFHHLAPNVSRDRMAPANADRIRGSVRQDLGLGPDDFMLLMIGSWFVRKGVDRSILALAAMPQALRTRTRLLVAGSDDPVRMKRLAARHEVAPVTQFLGPRDDVARLLLGADLLLHPARYENTGTAIVEALAAGLPSVVSGTCGYAHYVEEAHAGWVVPEPFCQETFSHLVHEALTGGSLAQVRRNALAFAATHDLYGMVDGAVAVIEGVLADKRTCANAGRGNVSQARTNHG